ncbi:DoxX family protein [Thermomonospora catenispora]|uniref:DoxX family protein n=1 Tax=Thermomonospora catenispora TaxID=2493090 RepID=UPI0011246105|nr:DoxX family protein [Thermomonospora catenispora]TNY38193.1 DoxX family protein [Thermomonospora catenispora]
MTAQTLSTAPVRSARRRVLWVLQILIAAFLLIGSAMPKFFGEQYAVETFEAIGWGQWFRYLTGAVEAAGAVALVIPRLSGPAAIGLIGLMIGAVLTQILVLVPAFALFPAALAVIFALVAHDRRAETRALLRSLLRR